MKQRNQLNISMRNSAKSWDSKNNGDLRNKMCWVKIAKHN
jgi:hypothetical protein